jgi:hypothetical protein
VVNTHFTLSKIAGVALLACVLTGSSVETNGKAIEIGVSGRANANASIASAGSFVAVAWAARTKEGVTDIFAVVSRDGGRSFGSPVRVNQVAGEAAVSGEQPPRIALLSRRAGDPALVAVWTARSSSGTRLVSARSTDGGRSFGPTTSVPGSDATGNRGWESMAINAQGDPVAVWLDHREVPARPAGTGASSGHQHGAMQHQTDGAARAQLSKIFFAKLNDPASARAIAPGVCYCCKTSVATGGDGSIVAAWRHVYPGNIRDIALAKSSDGGRGFSLPVRVSEDNWVLDGCPENGPAVAVDQTNAIHIVWPTLVRESGGNETLALFYAMSRDGQRFTKRQEIQTDGIPRHPQIAVGPAGKITVAWDEQLRSARRIIIARGTIDYSNPVRFTRESVTEEAGAFPTIAPVSDGVLVAWTSGSAENSVLRVARHAFPLVR